MPAAIAPPAPFANAPRPFERYQLVMPNSPTAAKIARDFVGTLLRTGAHAALADDARLCVSEVVANVYCHTCSRLVRVEVTVDGDQVAIHVTDDGPGPLPDPPERPEGEGGRGLLVVDGLATSWGSSTRQVNTRRTNTVWFVLTPPGRDTEPDTGPATATPGARPGTGARSGSGPTGSRSHR
ncbi:ATP-binding protein [Streptomyces sp. SID8356]|uniref:ATP-binding protein n=1 Tax=unclassified Streptomyces TaxID=2593676 RepID=UPI0003663811|nr:MULTISPECIES: ATP-binding protein [unclassified Streptomyces]MYT40226.1 ATP-binding protein [Streptomyces sp. SID8356]